MMRRSWWNYRGWTRCFPRNGLTGRAPARQEGGDGRCGHDGACSPGGRPHQPRRPVLDDSRGRRERTFYPTVGRLVADVTFLLGLFLVNVGSAELFTGNTLIVMAWASARVSSQRLFRNWLLVYVGHFVGALATTLLVFGSQQFTFGHGAAGAAVLATATAKVGFSFPQAVAPGVLCNSLVRLALWLSFSARSTADRVFAIVLSITAFVAAGFEHSIANMYLIPLGLSIRTAAPDSFWSALGRTANPRLTRERFLVDNLRPVILGNITGGGVLVGIVYCFVFLRPMRSAPR
jgi:formate transporter